MTITIGIPKEILKGENRVAIVPKVVENILATNKNLSIIIEKSAGINSNIPDDDYTSAGAVVTTSANVWSADIILKVTPPTSVELNKLKKNQLLISHLNPLENKELIKTLAKNGVNAIAMEKIPRTSRAQSMDSLSSQAGIAGYRAVLESTIHFKRFFPLMMTSAGSSKPAKVVILGVGVAGLQAIATAKRLGAQVEAFDVRPEVAEQIKSLGAKAITIDVGEETNGEGGYAKELSAQAKKKQQEGLQKILIKADIIISTAQIPGKKAPVLITKKTVELMQAGSVIIDMAAASGGNCPLTKADKIITVNNVTIVGTTNYPSLLSEDASMFYSKNLANVLNLLLEENNEINFNLNDDIISGSLVSLNGKVL